MLYFISTDLISSLLDPRFVDPRSTLIHVGAYGVMILFVFIIFMKSVIMIFSSKFNGRISKTT